MSGTKCYENLFQHLSEIVVHPFYELPSCSIYWYSPLTVVQLDLRVVGQLEPASTLVWLQSGKPLPCTPSSGYYIANLALNHSHSLPHRHVMDNQGLYLLQYLQRSAILPLHGSISESCMIGLTGRKKSNQPSLVFDKHLTTI